MPYRKDGDAIVEYKIVPEREMVVKIMNKAEFAILEDSLKAEIARDPKSIGDEYIAQMQEKLDEIIAAKAIIGGG